MRGKELAAYVASGIDTDHESISWDEAKEKLRNGLAVLVREGSASRNLTAILRGVIDEGIDVSSLASALMISILPISAMKAPSATAYKWQ